MSLPAPENIFGALHFFVDKPFLFPINADTASAKTPRELAPCRSSKSRSAAQPVSAEDTRVYIMPEDNKTIQPINASVDEVAKAMIRPSKGIRLLPSQISILSQKSTAKEISPVQGSLDLGIEMDAEFASA